MKNIEKIKQMTADEMAELFIADCNKCAFCNDYDCWEQDCKIGHIQWLESEE